MRQCCPLLGAISHRASPFHTMGPFMTAVAFLLVLLSALAHSTWNLLLKQSTHKVAFLGLATAVAFTVLLPAAVAIAITDGAGVNGLLLGLVTAVLHALYGTFLTRGYRLGDLSVVYPVSRGMGLALIPLGAAVLLDERISPPAIVGIALITVGVYAIHLEPRALRDVIQPLRAVNSPAGRTAVLTGVVIAAYSLWDKHALESLSPVPLNQFGMTGLTVILVPFALRGGLPQLQTEWRQRHWAIVAAGLMIPAAYLLVLAALTTSRVSYIGPAREVGIVFGTMFGVLLLGEGYGGFRIPASLIIVSGVVALALAP